MGVVLRKRGAMEDLCNELLELVLKRLPLRDAVRARVVCRRWRDRIDAEQFHFQSSRCRSYSPLVFKRTDDGQHTWWGYNNATGQWDPLPSLSHVPRSISFLPFVGSGHGLLGFKITNELSNYIVGNPYTHKWRTFKLADCWGDAAMFMISSGRDEFYVVAVRDEETHIYSSVADGWEKVGRTPSSVSGGQIVTRIKKKECAAVCNGCLYSASVDGDMLISFDMGTAQWTNDRISIPIDTTKRSMQLLECAGTIYAVTQDDTTGRVRVWGLIMEIREFSLIVEMPREFQEYLKPLDCKTTTMRRAKKVEKVWLKSFGHGHEFFFWRHRSLQAVRYDLVAQEWRKLPEFLLRDSELTGGREEPQVEIDAGFFEPRFEPFFRP
ncbi:F-box only protein 6 [Physcomitrium patens]|uniref:F-box domain-containing protein n=1 Tax=Physcomitrium patens TaxID=3218 RepID=A0A2K1JIU6_PHYPA|nr:F-box only protein 6-like [Physcomitrium patens]XP_024393820.1 F-box only protein 6-like [Physcomitrium patens]PNR41477.1 hypothetical protein PHYPA_018880 [Physcomitrium patens]|eukprot:XP_024393819.1 F-box only protein 6-like [Physcomitrella patens]